MIEQPIENQREYLLTVSAKNSEAWMKLEFSSTSEFCNQSKGKTLEMFDFQMENIRARLMKLFDKQQIS